MIKRNIANPDKIYQFCAISQKQIIKKKLIN